MKEILKPGIKKVHYIMIMFVLKQWLHYGRNAADLSQTSLAMRLLMKQLKLNGPYLVILFMIIELLWTVLLFLDSDIP